MMSDKAFQPRAVHVRPRRWQPVLATTAVCLALWAALVHLRLFPFPPPFPFPLPSIITIPSGSRSGSGSVPPSTTKDLDFRWSHVVPRRSLVYTPCFGSYQCARLSVPLNWNASQEQREAGPHAAVAVIKLPAKVPVTHPRYGGPVILNPGGPGESGVHQVLADGRHIQTILDSPDEGQLFDILSFDPRGVNNTTPALSCFPHAFNQQTWLLRFPDIGLLWDSDSVVGLEWARAAALGASCSAGRTDVDMLPYVNTAQVVQDMVEIIEREGEWRAWEAERLLGREPDQDAAKQSILQRTAYHPAKEKIQFWGMSYGTTIGSTFAAMHPERVHRLVLDGNMDPADHYAGGFEHSLQDADKVVAKHAEYCHQAGPGKCPLYDGTSPDAVHARFTAIMDALKASPLAVPNLPGSMGPEIVTYGDIHLSLLGSVYFPYALTELFWSLLPALEARNVSHPHIRSLAKRKQQATMMNPAPQPASASAPAPAGCDPTAGAGDAHSCQPYAAWAGAFATISCMDAGGGPSSLTRASFAAHRAVLAAQSRWVSPTWSRNKLMCEGVPVPPAWRPVPRHGFTQQEWANTSHPILLLGNTRDTATPLANAERVARDLFPGSVVVRLDAEGHCSHATPSLCAARIVRAYFQTGRLPEPGTVCYPEKKPFLGCVREGGCHFDEDETRLWEALDELADTYGFSKRKDDDKDDEVQMDLWNAHLRLLT